MSSRAQLDPPRRLRIREGIDRRSRPAAVLVAARAEIDQIDRQLVALLRERTRQARRAGAAKAQLGRGIVDLAREQAMFEERRAWAVEHDLDVEGVTRLFEAAVLVSRRAQERRGGAAEAPRKNVAPAKRLRQQVRGR